MELSFGPEYAAFRAEVQRFIEENRALSPNAGAGVAAAGTGTRASDITPKQPMIGPALPPQQR